MAIIELYTQKDGAFVSTKHEGEPMPFVLANIPDGVPFKIYKDSVCEDNDVTENYDELQTDGVFYIVEGAGGGALSFVGKVFSFILKPIMKWLTPSVDTSTPNSQVESPNNSLSDRTNKPRPYLRTYDICGTVQCIPSDLMQSYILYNDAGKAVEYGYYDVCRGSVSTPAEGITDGDTKLQDISESSVAVYTPYTSPNSGSPQTLVGDAITEPLFITVSSNEIDGPTLKAPNDLQSYISPISTAQLSGTTGKITDATGNSEFSAFLSVGDVARLSDIVVNNTPTTGQTATLSGEYIVTAVSDVDISLNVTGNLAEWSKLGATVWTIATNSAATVGPSNLTEASFTDWVVLDSLKHTRIVANISAENGLYKTPDNATKKQASVTAEMQYQLLDDNSNPYGPLYSAQRTITGRTSDSRGVSIIANLLTAAYVRVRCRRVTDQDLAYAGTVVDEIKYVKLYGQTQDTTPNYGNRTTVHTARKQTVRATAVKSPKLALMTTELVYKYLGNGAFDSVLTPNTQAVQSLIRVMNDPVVGGLTLSNSNMDALLATQSKIETYFNNPVAGQFCYTFDTYTTTAQDIVNTIAEAIFCKAYRQGHSILLDFDRPRSGPSMVFTHRSKAPSGEKWLRNFNDRSAYDSLEFQYIAPDTNTQTTLKIPSIGGKNTEKYTSKGVRNAQQAYWLAHRRYMKNQLAKLSVEFTALEEGALARVGRTISVVKGSRVAPYDGYIVAVDGLKLTLSQPVEFTYGLEHSIILKKRDGSVQSAIVTRGANSREVILSSALSEAPYTGNSALKTEFSFGSDDRHAGQHIVVSTVEPSGDRTVKITGYNYSDDFYLYDGVPAFFGGFSNGFSNGFN